jgi:hypothetical protein
VKQFLVDFLESYSEKFGYTASIEEEGTQGIIHTPYGTLGIEQTAEDEIRFLKIEPLDANDDDQISSLIKINKHFKGSLKTAAEEHAAEEEEEEETVPVGKKTAAKPPAKPPAPVPEAESAPEAEGSEETDSLGRVCPPPSNKPPAHFTKPEKAKGGKKTANDKIVPPAEVEPPLPATAIPGTHAYGIAQRAKEAAAKTGVAVPGETIVPPVKNALGNSDAAMAKAAAATIGGGKKTPPKADPPDEPMAVESDATEDVGSPSLDDIMDGKVTAPVKPAASQPPAVKPAPVVPQRATVVQPAKQEMAVSQPLSPGAFKKAKRQNAKLRLSLSGFSGSGKTVSALLIAYGITKDWSKIAVVDSEGKSAQLYEGATIGTVIIGQYDVLEMEPPFQVERLITAIKMAETAGYKVLIIDSASPYWQGEGGALEAHSEATKRGGNSFVAWAPVTAKQNRLMDTIIGSKIHIIVTLRAKVEYVMDSSGGRTQVRKIGTESIQRQGFIYDMTMQLDLSQDHVAEVVKDRTNLFDQQHFVPDVEMGEKLRAWLEIES